MEPALRAALVALSQKRLDDAIADLVTEREHGVFKSARARLSEQDTVVAVIGRQGIGKSTLMSALLGRRLLPIDETETTNVICAVRDAEDSPERAIVTYNDGSIEEGAATESFLRRFTDEQENQGNALGVRSVDVYLQNALLPKGMVLADTPGVGSLTASTARVTMDFLPRISLGIFLMGTAPSLLDSEKLFLRATWGFSRSFLFVQNAWAASDVELEEGRTDNLEKLQRIAKEEGYQCEVELLLVDVEEGLEGQCARDQERIERSGLAKLMSAISERASAGALSMRVLANVPALLEVLKTADQGARARQRNLEEQALQDQRGFEDRQRMAYEELDGLSRTWNERAREFDRVIEATTSKLRDDVQERVDEAEARLLAIATGRKMSAERLAEAVSEQLTMAVKVPANEFQREYGHVLREFLEDAGRLRGLALDVSGKVPGIEEAASEASDHEAFSKAGGFVENLGALGAGGIAFGAAWAAGAALVAGEGMAAAVAAGTAAIPGVGLAIAGAALLGGYILKRMHEGKALDKLIPAINEAARKAKSGTARELTDAVREHANTVRDYLDTQMKRALDQQRAVLQQLGHDRTQSTENRVALRATLADHQEVINEAAIPVQALISFTKGAKV